MNYRDSVTHILDALVSLNDKLDTLTCISTGTVDQELFCICEEIRNLLVDQDGEDLLS